MTKIRYLLTVLGVGLLAGFGLPAPVGAAVPHVLRVGTWNGVPGNVASLDKAMAKLRPGDWLLIAPGDYHPEMDRSTDQAASDTPAALLDTAANTHVRGMNRNSVIIDGTRPGSAPCSAAPADQDFGPTDGSGTHRGRNGIEAVVDGTYFENLTVCNFLAGSTDSGNEIWWNGGDDGGHIGLGS